MRSIILCSLFLITSLIGCEAQPAPESPADDAFVLRIATYNIEDVRTADVLNADHARLKKAAATIQRLRPAIILINEITYDQQGVAGVGESDTEGQNGQRFADTFLAVSQGDDLEPIRYRAFMAPSNTGQASGFDLNNDGKVVTDAPPLAPPNPDGSPARQTQEQRDFGGDAWGFGTFPGQYAMALLVREDLEILHDEVRTFRYLPWSSMPDAVLPVNPETDSPWYSGEAGAQFRLSSKSHWDVPVRLPDGTTLHILASHPTPPAFDGPEKRNVLRNHDEIRFWGDYINGADYIVDDSSRTGGLAEDAHFVLLGDQNADPTGGSSHNDPMGTWLLSHPRVNGDFIPQATPDGISAYPRLDPYDTAAWGLRVDYVLPSSNLEVVQGGIDRPVGADTTGIEVSDHFPVWLDIAIQ